MAIININIERKAKTYTSSADDKDTPAKVAAVKRPRKKLSKGTHIAGLCIIGLFLVVAGTVGWKIFIWQPANIDPFTASILGSVQFPLYHPTVIPDGFHVDTKSVNEPTTGVVVFTLTGPKGSKVYFSEEARPNKYDIGGFFTKFSGLKEFGVQDGAVAVGKLYNGREEIGSLVNNSVWIIGNTTAKIPMNQLTSMFMSLTSKTSIQG